MMTMPSMEEFSDLHYTPSLSQGNIHSLTVLNLFGGVNNILFASLRKKLCLISFLENSKNALIPHVKDVIFSNIPNGAEVVALDSFNRSTDRDDFRIGILVCKNNALDDKLESCLNIYTEQDNLQPGHAFNIDNIAQNCFVLDLNYMVHHFTHAYRLVNPGDPDSREIVWICSGVDMKLHVYQEDQVSHSYSEVPLKEVFPELVNIPNHTVVFWLQIEYLQNFSRRASVLSCVSGSVYLYIADVKKNTVETYIDMSNPLISQAQFFSVKSQPTEPREIPEQDEDQESDLIKFQDFHLLVLNANDDAVVYRNVAEEGFAHRQILSKRNVNTHETHLCACVADINMDGLNEIIIGTYEKKLLIFKVNTARWEFYSEIPTSNAVHTVKYVDLTSDGVKELVIHTLSGVLVLQHKPERVKQILQSRLAATLNSGKTEIEKTQSDLSDTFEKMLL